MPYRSMATSCSRTLLLLALPASLLLARSAEALPVNACATAGSANPSRFLLSSLSIGQQIQCQNLLFTLGDPAALKAQDDGSGFLYLEWNPFDASGLLPDPAAPLNYEDDIFSLGVQFSASHISSSSQGFSYALAVIDSATALRYTLETAQLDSIITQLPAGRLRPAGTPASSVTMQIRDGMTLSSVGTLVSNRLDPQPWIALDPPERTRIMVTNTWEVGSFSTLSGYRDSFSLIDPPTQSVPAPLPLAGASASVAISRRLRRLRSRSLRVGR